MGRLSWRPMERLCAIGVIKAASAARCRFSAFDSPPGHGEPSL
jgi:hypothetical protein